jgi:predicted ATPase/class 3 adenylate cyclase/Tfp pilus assembly protein PilF
MIVNKTLLFTDVVDSTRLNETLGDDAMRALWQSHDASARELIRKWRGQEIARSDGFFLLFAHAADSVGFARDYHRAIGGLHDLLRARVGITAGPVTLVENSEADKLVGAPKFEVFGVTVAIAARIMSAALGGQTLVTSEIVEQLGAVRSRRLGFWRFKGIDEPMELFAIGESGPEIEPPPDSAKAYRVVRTADGWNPARHIANNLPADRDRFVGRANAVASLSKLFDQDVRLVTLFGIGGIGKTRLALHYARRWLGDYPGGVWFCDLSAARDPDGIVHAVAQGLDIALGRSDPVQQIAAGIAGRGACLVIVDNFEQVSQHAEATIGVWLSRSPDARFLVTSRALLGIVGETAFTLDPLETAEGAELFHLRARAVHASLPGSVEEDACVARLVALLDGLPLAIELAAARTPVMSPENLLQRMDQRFTLLASRGGRHRRQATLRATLDWSWDLLSGPERMALAQLSVFTGGFTLDAVEAVIDAGASGRSPASLDLLQSLLDKSLVRQVDANRFDLLVMVKEYAAERLLEMSAAESPTLKRAAEARHCAYFVSPIVGERASFAIRELDNLVVACRRAIERSATDDAVAALAVAWEGLKLQGPLHTGVELSSAIRARGGTSPHADARLHRIVGSAFYALGEIGRAQSEFEKGLGLAAAVGDRILEAQLQGHLGDLHANSGQTDAAASCFNAALATAREFGVPTLECAVVNSLGSLHESLGELDIAQQNYETALAISRASRDRRWEAGSLGNLAQMQAAKGNHRAAEPLYFEAIAIARELDDRRWEGNARCNLGITCLALGKLDEARRQLELAQVIARQLGLRRLEAVTLCNLGIVADAKGDTDDARDAFERAIAVARALSDRRSEGQFLTYLGALDGKAADYASARDRLSAAEKLLESVSDRLSLGLALSCRSEVEQRGGATAVAREFLRRAEDLALDLRPEPESEFGAALACARAALS